VYFNFSYSILLFIVIYHKNFAILHLKVFSFTKLLNFYVLLLLKLIIFLMLFIISKKLLNPLIFVVSLQENYLFYFQLLIYLLDYPLRLTFNLR